MRVDRFRCAATLSYCMLLAAFAPSQALAQPHPERPSVYDLTDQEVDYAKFVDVNGPAEASFWFSVSRICRLTIEIPRETGFKVAYSLRTEKGSDLKRALMGTNPKRVDIELPPGRFEFLIRAKRDAGYYTYRLSTYCER